MNEMTTFVGTKPYRMAADGYLKCIELGGFGDAHVELVDGELIESEGYEIEGGKVVPPKQGVRPYRVSTEIYLRMIDAGSFGDAHVELVDGELIEMSPSHSEHGRLMLLLGHLLYQAYADTDFVLYGDIITKFDDSNTRAPDIAVVDKGIGDRKQLVPSDILLAVEIAGSTLNVDLGRKRIDYASAGIRHYWVVDVEGRRTHCYADPQGADYAAIQVVPFGEAVAVPGADGVIVVA